MKKCFALLIAGVFLAAVGCGESHPSGKVDTSDPNKVIGTMTPLPKTKDPTGLSGMPKGGAGPKAP